MDSIKKTEFQVALTYSQKALLTKLCRSVLSQNPPVRIDVHRDVMYLVFKSGGLLQKEAISGCMAYGSHGDLSTTECGWFSKVAQTIESLREGWKKDNCPLPYTFTFEEVQAGRWRLSEVTLTHEGGSDLKLQEIPSDESPVRSTISSSGD